jgi:hypothetical protein
MTPLLWLVAGHFLGDFAFQSDWMATQKGKSWEINLYHAAVYTATIFVVATIGGVTLSVLALAILIVSHFCIDPFKARWNLIKSIWIDQLLHLLVLIAVVATL